MCAPVPTGVVTSRSDSTVESRSPLVQPRVLPVAGILVGKSAVHGGAEASDMCAEASDVLLHGLADARRVCAVALLLQPHVLLVASILGGKAAVHGLAEASDMLLHGLTDALVVCALPLLLQPHVLLVAGILRGPVAALAAADVPPPCSSGPTPNPVEVSPATLARSSGGVEGGASSTRAVSPRDEAEAVADVPPPFSGGAAPISVGISLAAAAISSGVDPLS